jgi:hypothetical protein
VRLTRPPSAVLNTATVREATNCSGSRPFALQYADITTR